MIRFGVNSLNVKLYDLGVGNRLIMEGKLRFRERYWESDEGRKREKGSKVKAMQRIVRVDWQAWVLSGGCQVRTVSACASSDTRPPMLDRTDIESWQQRPFKMGKFREILAEGTKGALL
ncbi:hypothetical protein Tco_0428672 [Tanacetum coccineum]